MSADIGCPVGDDSVLCRLDTRDKQGEVYAFFCFITNALAAVTMIILLFYHGHKVFQDLFTKERASVAHRKKHPNTSNAYKRVSILILLSIISFTGSAISGAVSFSSQTADSCGKAIAIMTAFFQAGKTFMCLAFLYRLERIYSKSPFKYPSSCIDFFKIVLVLYGVIIIVLTIFYVSAEGQIVTYGNALSFPNLCQGNNVDVYLKLAVSIIVEDLGCTIGFWWGYRLPLRQTYAAFRKKSPKIARKIAYSGHKMGVLVATATVSTLVLTLLAGITNIGAIGVPIGVINTISMMYMTAYYLDDVHYGRWCYICITFCTSPEPEEELEIALSEESYHTADTMSQLREAAAKIEVGLNLNSKSNNKSQEMTKVENVNVDEQEKKEEEEVTEKDNKIQS